MAKKDTKVSEIQKEYDKSFKEIRSLLKTIGEDVTNPQSTLYPPTVKKLRSLLGEPPKKTPPPESDAPSTASDKKTSTSAKSLDTSKGAKPNATPNTEDSSPSSTPSNAPGEKASGNAIKPGANIPRPAGSRKGGGQSETAVKTGASLSKASNGATPAGRKNAPNPGGYSNSPAFSAAPSDIPKPRLVNKTYSNIPKPSALGTVKRPSNNNPYAAGLGNRPARPQQGGGRPGGKPGQRRLLKPGECPPRQAQGGAGGFNNGRPGTQGKPGAFAGKPGQNRPGFAGKGAYRPTRRGEKAGAFGGVKTASQGGRKGPKNPEVDIEMPTTHGFKVPKGDGKVVVRLKQGATLTDFADKIGAGANDLSGILFKEFGQMVTATQSVDEETLELLAVELGYIIETVTEDDLDRELLEGFDIDLNAEESDAENLEVRPPVVTVMGHVDHGKTRLLDAIRKTNVIEGEAGGITQRIGAYQIHLDHQGVDRKITFIDTPGHEAFTAMRARGAEITDVAILVVAADDGVMPQTVEAINHAQSAGVPIVVAVNKIDKEGANPDKVRGQLTEFNLVPEEYGGDTMFVNISAKQGDGITELLDAVLLTVDAALEITANPNMLSRGAVIEARLDKGRGPVMSVLVQTGTIRIGDPIVAGRSYGRVRAMYNEHGHKLKEAYPSCPVRILGMQSVPTAGDSFLVAEDERTARQIAEARESAHRAALLAKRSKRMTLEALKDAVAEGKVDRLNLIIKGDTSGSVEALEDALLKLEEQAELNNEVGLNVIHRGVGSITQNDVNLATVDEAVIIGFNVKPAGMAGDLADAEGVDIRYYDVIYQVIEDIELSLHGMLKPEYEEEMIGYAEVREIFKSSRAGTIAGCMVKGGVIKRNAIAKVMRGETLHKEDLKIDNLKRFKDDASSVKEGFECGISFNNFDDLEPGDVIEAYEMVEKKREIPKIASKTQ